MGKRYNDAIQAQFRMRLLTEKAVQLLMNLTCYYTKLANITANTWRDGEIAAGRSGEFTTEILDTIYFEARKYIFIFRFYYSMRGDFRMSDNTWDRVMTQLMARDFAHVEGKVHDMDHTNMQNFIDSTWKWLGLAPGFDIHNAYGFLDNRPVEGFTYGCVYGPQYNPPPIMNRHY